VVVLGAGILGVSTAWFLAQAGHAVVVVDRQDAPALETSFANGAQISVSFCEPWASPTAPWKVAKWLLRADAPLLFRPQLDWRQWEWGLRFLGECSATAFERNVRQLVALGRYSQQTLQQLVAQTGIEYDRLACGILHFCSSQKELDQGAHAAALMRRYGVDRQVLDRRQVLAIEPALAGFAGLAGGTFTPSDESGDACRFTQALAQRCEALGVQFRFGCEVLGLERDGERVAAVRVRHRAGPEATRLTADAFVAALGAYTPALLRPLGERLQIYPAKGYSATLRLLAPERASVVSLLDDSHKLAISRLGDRIRVAGTAELNGYDTSLDTHTAHVRCQALLRRYEALFPGVADCSEPNFWTGLRPSTPSNRPYIGRSRVARNLWLNSGHGTLGWTHGAGSGRALAELMSGRQPELAFDFYGGAVRGS
jgi:D-amino-acid dehydrogenase